MLTGKIGVTTARNATGGTAAAQARAWAEQLGAIYVERPHNMGVDELMAQHELAALVVGEKDGPRIHSDAGSFAYHPGMAVLRLQPSAPMLSVRQERLWGWRLRRCCILL